MDEALQVLAMVHTKYPDEDIALNLVGFSRGGVACLMMANRVSNPTSYSHVKKINILAFDPVPGGLDPIGNFGEAFTLSSKVNQYIGIYARDERTYMFEPVIPKVSSSATKVLTVLFPGSHETMVGNLQIDGHSVVTNTFDSTAENPNLKDVSDVSR